MADPRQGPRAAPKRRGRDEWARAGRYCRLDALHVCVRAASASASVFSATLYPATFYPATFYSTTFYPGISRAEEEEGRLVGAGAVCEWRSCVWGARCEEEEPSAEEAEEGC